MSRSTELINRWVPRLVTVDLRSRWCTSGLLSCKLIYLREQATIYSARLPFENGGFGWIMWLMILDEDGFTHDLFSFFTHFQVSFPAMHGPWSINKPRSILEQLWEKKHEKSMKKPWKNYEKPWKTMKNRGKRNPIKNLVPSCVVFAQQIDLMANWWLARLTSPDAQTQRETAKKWRQ